MEDKNRKPSFGLPENWDNIPEKERLELQKPLIFPNSEKLFRRFSFGLTLAITVYMVFFHEYRSKNHCFQPVRRWLTKQKMDFFSLKPEELEHVTEREKLKKP